MTKQELIEKITEMPDDIQIFVNDKMDYDAIDVRIFTKPKDKAFLDWYFGP